MTQAQAQQVVLLVFGATTGVVVWDSIKKTGHATPPPRTLFALLILGAGLAAGAAVAPQVAGPFSILLGLAVVLSRMGPDAQKGTGAIKSWLPF